MDEQIKQRVVGAIVLVSLAVIFIPMLFEGNRDMGELSISETNIPPFPEQKFEEKVRPLPTVEEIEKKIAPPEIISKPELPVAPPEKPEKKTDDKKQKAIVKPAWVIQVGSFGQEDNAENFVTRLKTADFPAFVRSHSDSKRQMYRVFVGPELDKKRAEKNKAELEKRFKVKGILLEFSPKI